MKTFNALLKEQMSLCNQASYAFCIHYKKLGYTKRRITYLWNVLIAKCVYRLLKKMWLKNA